MLYNRCTCVMMVEAWEIPLLLFAYFAYNITELTFIAYLGSYPRVNYLLTFVFLECCGYNPPIPLILEVSKDLLEFRFHIVLA